MRVYMHDLCAEFLGLDDIRKGYRVRLSHIAAHNQNRIAIHQVLRKSGGSATSKRYTQTGYRGTVSYTGLVLNRDDAQSASEELLHHIILFNIQGCASQRGDSQRMINLAPIWQSFHKRLVA